MRCYGRRWRPADDVLPARPLGVGGRTRIARGSPLEQRVRVFGGAPEAFARLELSDRAAAQ